MIGSVVGVAAGSLIAGGAGVAHAADSKVELGVVGNTLAYDKSALSAIASEVEVEFTNSSAIQHDVRVSTMGADLGGTSVISNNVASETLSLDPGTYTFFCSVGTHRAAGMEGTLTVAEAPAPTPTDPDPTDPSAPDQVTPVAPSLDVSAANKQGVKKLKATIVSDSDATLALAGKARIPTRGAGKSSVGIAKTKSYALKELSLDLEAGVEEEVRLKFVKHSKSVKQITKLLKRDSKARRGSKATIELVASNDAGSSATEELKVKLKR